MITKFSSSTIKKLGHYVYTYEDPDSGETIYIGEGKGNRVFDHLKGGVDKPLTKKLNMLKRRGKHPKINILSHGLTKEEALIAEQVAIDLLGIDNLSNQKRGLDSRKFGKVDVESLERKYSGKGLGPEDITENVIFIRINQGYYSEITDLELYESTRGYWVVSPENASKAKYAMPVYDGVILEVYKIATWLPSGTTHMETRTCKRITGRYEFVGKRAPKRIRDKYINKSVAEFFAYGNTNPIKYEGPIFR